MVSTVQHKVVRAVRHIRPRRHLHTSEDKQTENTTKFHGPCDMEDISPISDDGSKQHSPPSSSESPTSSIDFDNIRLTSKVVPCSKRVATVSTREDFPRKIPLKAKDKRNFDLSLISSRHLLSLVKDNTTNGLKSDLFDVEETETVNFIMKGYLRMLQKWNERLHSTFHIRKQPRTLVSKRQLFALHWWLKSLVHRLRSSSTSSYLTALIYLDRFLDSPEFLSYCSPSTLCPFEITFITCLILASKYHEDSAIGVRNVEWINAVFDIVRVFKTSRVRDYRCLMHMKREDSGCTWTALFSSALFTSKLLNRCEIQVLNVLDYRLRVQEKDISALLTELLGSKNQTAAMSSMLSFHKHGRHQRQSSKNHPKEKLASSKVNAKTDLSKQNTNSISKTTSVAV